MDRNTLFKAYDVFISYKSDEREDAEWIQAILEKEGLIVWRDERLADTAGQAYDLTINDALDQSAKVLVLWSNLAIRSDWVRGEATKALNQQKLVPLMLEPGVELPAPFNLGQYVTKEQVAADSAALFRALGTVAPSGAPTPALSQPLEDLDHLPDTYTGRLFGRDSELRELSRAWDGHDAHVAVYDAIGGTGKTSLFHHFLHQQLIPAAWRGCRAAFAYSFYSQGATEDKQVDADEFFTRAFKLFGQTQLGQEKQAAYRAELKEALELRAALERGGQNPDKVPLPPDWPPTKPGEKGPALAELIQSVRSLLIIDGLEPLQYVAGKGQSRDTESSAAGHYGGIKDLDVKLLIQRLARHNPGLCLISTRVPVTEVDESYRFVRKEKLDPLDAEAGTALLRHLGVQPEFPEHEEITPALQAEFSAAVKDLDGHAFALNLAGRFVAAHRNGQLKAIRDIPHLDQSENVSESYRSPFRVFRTVEFGLLRQMSEQAEKGQDPFNTTAARQLALLYFLGLFDRPASLKLLDEVFVSRRGDNPVAPADSREIKGDKIVAPPRRSLAAIIKELFGVRPGKLTPNAPKFDTLPLGDLFDAFAGSTLEQIRYALGQLSRQGLVAKARQVRNTETGLLEWEELPLSGHGSEAWETNQIDCHPLVREYFGWRLERLDAATFQLGHGRLYDFYRYRGLPEAFQDPVAYGILAMKAAYGDNAKLALDMHLEGKLSASDTANLPPSVGNAPIELLKSKIDILQSSILPQALAAFRPEDAEAMEPLFSAITHGCLAQRQEECFNEVYWPRIARGAEAFATAKLGLFGQDLAAVASFFEEPFRLPSQNLHLSRQALVLSLAGFALRAIGRLPDAVEPMRAGVAKSAELEDAIGAATDAGNLSELLVTLGRLDDGEVAEDLRIRDPQARMDLPSSSRPGADGCGDPLLHFQGGALASSAQAVRFADQSGDLFQRMGDRCKQAAALLARGRLSEAEERFREAERLQQQRQPELPRLYSLSGFLYGDLLLARRRPEEVAERAESMCSFYDSIGKQVTILDIALAQLQLAQARSQAKLITDYRLLITDHFNPALTALQQANSENHLPRAHLARAEALLECGTRNSEGGILSEEARKQIQEDLTEAESIALRGPMPLFLAEANLLAARTALVVGMAELAREHRDKAAELIAKHHYGRREPDLAVLDAEMALALDCCSPLPLLDRQPAAESAPEPSTTDSTPPADAPPPPQQAAASPEKRQQAAAVQGFFETACAAVGGEGWWHLMDRLEAMAVGRPEFEAQLQPLREAEKAYHAERKAYLSEQAVASTGPSFSPADVLSQLPQEVIANIAEQTGQPADWQRWPPELQQQVVQAVIQAQQGQ